MSLKFLLSSGRNSDLFGAESLESDPWWHCGYLCVSTQTVLEFPAELVENGKMAGQRDFMEMWFQQNPVAL